MEIHDFHYDRCVYDQNFSQATNELVEDVPVCLGDGLNCNFDHPRGQHGLSGDTIQPCSSSTTNC